MDQNTHFNQQEIPVKATLDVQTVETALNDLWRKKAGVGSVSEGEDGAMMRARVLNLMFYVTNAEAASEVNDILAEITETHPCRALLMLAEAQESDHDLEMFISTYCPDASGAGGHRLCCEQVTLKARGRFTLELPSAATPLLVSDLPIFLCWRDEVRADDEILQSLNRAADRVVVDSAEFQNPLAEMAALVRFVSRRRAFDVAFSDLNWSRLTSWRALLASFYDVQDYRPALEQLSHVMIEYVAPAREAKADGSRGSGADGAMEAGAAVAKEASAVIAPQALMMAGWLASRLGWQPLTDEAPQVSLKNSPDNARDKLDQSENLDQTENESQAENDDTREVFMLRDGRRIKLSFRRVSRPEMKQGRLARVELKTEAESVATFVVSRSEDGLYLETQVSRGEDVRAARVLKVRNRSAAVLLGRELEIICHEEVYEDALKRAASIVRLG